MNAMKRMYNLLLAAMMLLSCFLVPTAMAEDEPVTITLNVTNTPVQGDIVLEKTGLQLVRFEDEKDDFGNTVMRPVYQNAYLAGAVFELYAAEDIVGKEGTVFYHAGDLVETLTTSGTGAVRSRLLPLGNYSLKEISAPEGFVFSTEPYPIALAAVDQKTAVVEINVSAVNTYLPIRVTLRKQKEELRREETDDGMVHQTIAVTAGEGFVFGLYNSSVIAYGDSQKLPANTLMATGATDAKGILTFAGMFPHGQYYLKELAVPDGWQISTTKYPIVLTTANMSADGDEIEVTLAEPILNHLIHTPVTITKTDITGAEKLPGALIEVFDSEGTVIYREYTDENGEIPDIPVAPGTYTFRETYAPDGYALNVAVKTFTVSASGKVTGDTVIRDDFNRVAILKTQSNGDPLPGAVFGLFNSENEKVLEAVSDDTGYVLFSRIPHGSYTIREISAPHGYHASSEEWQITVDGTFVNSENPLATVVNTPAPGRIVIEKLDELDRHPIAGVVFDIYEIDTNGAEGDLVASMTTDASGHAESPDLFSAEYLVKERTLPTGYTGTPWSERITVDMDQTITRTVTNKPIQGLIRILKTDSETSKGLPGAVFTVTRISGLPSHGDDGIGEIVAVITSGKDGIAETPLLTWGEYEIVETRVPDGYLDSGYSVTIHIPADETVESENDAQK